MGHTCEGDDTADEPDRAPVSATPGHSIAKFRGESVIGEIAAKDLAEEYAPVSATAPPVLGQYN